MLTVREVAEKLSISEEHVRRLARDGDLPGFKVRQAWRFPNDLAERLLADRVQGTCGERATHVQDDTTHVQEACS